MSFMKRLGIAVLVIAIVMVAILLTPYTPSNLVSGGSEGGEESDDPANCKHQYREEEVIAATCLQEGSAVYECRKCDMVYTMKLPPNHIVENGSCTICGQEAHNEDELEFKPTDDGEGYIVYMSKIGKEWTDIIIPSHIYGKPVVQIGGGLDYSSSGSDSILRRVYIPDTVKTIGMGAFESCVSLETLTIPEGVELIGASAFDFCKNLKSILLPSTVTSIGADAFSYCYAMEHFEVHPFNDHFLSIDGNLYADGGKTFYRYAGNKQDTSLVIPNGVTKIADSACADSFILESITIPEGVQTIGRNAFLACNNLKSLVIPESVKVIGEAAFALSYQLESISLPAGLEKINSYTFNGCENLSEVTYAGTVEQWNGLEKGYHWNSQCPFTEVICSDGLA